MKQLNTDLLGPVEEIRSQIKGFYEAGVPADRLERLFGINQRRVSRWRREYGWFKPRTRSSIGETEIFGNYDAADKNHPANIIRRCVRTMAANGINLVDIVEETGLSRRVVNYLVGEILEFEAIIRYLTPARALEEKMTSILQTRDQLTKDDFKQLEAFSKTHYKLACAGRL